MVLSVAADLKVGAYEKPAMKNPLPLFVVSALLFIFGIGFVVVAATTAIVSGDLVFSHKKGDLLVCLEANTGKQLWETNKVKSSLHSLTLCGDGVFVFTDKGELIRADITARGYKEVSRTVLIRPTTRDVQLVVYAAPAYANRHVFARNDEELICASLAADP